MRKNIEIQSWRKVNKSSSHIYADLECLLEKMHSCKNNPEKSYTEKKTKHAPSGYSLFRNCPFHATKNKLDWYKGIDCTERICKNVREHAIKIINFEKKRNYTAN